MRPDQSTATTRTELRRRPDQHLAPFGPGSEREWTLVGEPHRVARVERAGTLEVGGAAALTWPKGDTAQEKPAIDYLNGRVISIAAGTNEMQRNGIGERVLGLPREPSFDTTKAFNEVLRNSRSWSGKVG